MTPTIAARPAADEHHPYYAAYIDRVPPGELVDILEVQVDELKSLSASIDDADASVLHPPYTWTIKQVFGHLVDCERIMGNRIHRFSSGDVQSLPGFDENAYARNYEESVTDLAELVDELVHCRRANLLMLRRISPRAWDFRGEADGKEITVRALAYVLAGHLLHHLEIARKRLGLA